MRKRRRAYSEESPVSREMFSSLTTSVRLEDWLDILGNVKGGCIAGTIRRDREVISIAICALVALEDCGDSRNADLD